LKFRRIGSSELFVSTVGYGAWEIGGKGWKAGTEDESVEIVKKAFDNGITFFDTAPIYGMGRSERIVGKALKKVRDRVVIATKVGLIWDDAGKVRKCLRKNSILQEIDDSLRRLQTDYVDLYQIHWPDEGTPAHETAEALQMILQSKKARYIGVSNYSVAQMRELSNYVPIVSLQPPYSMLDRGIEKEILPYIRQQGMSTIPYSPLAKGLLTGKISADYEVGPGDARGLDKNFTDRERFLRNIDRVERLKKIADELQVSLTQLAIKWLLHKPEVCSVIAGTTSEKHLKDNIGAADWELSEKTYEKITTIVSDEELFE